jgi:hypothetical protein
MDSGASGNNRKSRPGRVPYFDDKLNGQNRLDFKNQFHILPAMILRLLPVLCLCLFLTACGRKSQSANPPPVSAAAQVDADAAPASQPTAAPVMQQAYTPPPQAGLGPPVMLPTQPTVIPAGANWDATLDALSDALRHYVVNTRSAPKDFQDFATRDLLQAPPPPPGKAYAIGPHGKVVLVNQ